MKILILLVMVVSLISCNKVCDIAKKGTEKVTDKLEPHWECDNKALYDYLAVKIGDKVCKNDEGTQKLSRIDLLSLCPIAVNILSNIGAVAIVKEVPSCNFKKVSTSLKNADFLCQFLGI